MFKKKIDEIGDSQNKSTKERSVSSISTNNLINTIDENQIGFT